MRVAAIVHNPDLHSLESLLRRLRLCPEIRFLLVTTSPQQKEATLAVCRAELSGSTELYVLDHQGDDFIGLLSVLPTLTANSCDVALNIPMGAFPNWLAAGELLGDEIPDALRLDPVLDPAGDIIRLFADTPDLGLLGAADLYLSTKHETGCEVEKTSMLQTIAAGLDPARGWGYFAGRTFWFRPRCFAPLAGLREQLLDGGSTHHQASPPTPRSRAAQQIFGLMPQLADMRTSLVYFDDKQNPRFVPAELSRRRLGSPYCLTTTLSGFRRLQENCHFLAGQHAFDHAHYLPCFTPSNNRVDAIHHYLRYGVYEECNPNPDFDSAWYWEEHSDVLQQGTNPLVHYLQGGKAEGRTIFPASENLIGSMEKVAKTGLFDPDLYLRSAPAGSIPKDEVLEHFCTRGWPEGRPPCSGRHFDPVWYESEYLHDWRKPINPLLHYAVCRYQRDMLPRPRPPALTNTGRKMSAAPARRACLFAAYDPDNLVDECVIRYIRELSRHADVFFLSDNNLPPGELAKLAGCTSGAWGVRHAAYDFGSYLRLARDFVGWEKLREYDEVLLVNDSAYLLRPLDEVFDKMNDRDCSWWGLQGTKGVFATRHVPENRFPARILWKQVVEQMLPTFEDTARYDFLMGSYFLAFRPPAFDELSRVLTTVRREKYKKNVIYKYEVNLTRRLILAGHAPSSFMDHLYPFHPVYTENHFEMIANGFPLLKRVLLTENNYRVPDLWQWQDKLKRIVPDLDVASLEAHLSRVCDHQQLQANLHVSPDEGFFVPANRLEPASDSRQRRAA